MDVSTKVAEKQLGLTHLRTRCVCLFVSSFQSIRISRSQFVREFVPNRISLLMRLRFMLFQFSCDPRIKTSRKNLVCRPSS